MRRRLPGHVRRRLYTKPIRHSVRVRVQVTDNGYILGYGYGTVYTASGWMTALRLDTYNQPPHTHRELQIVIQ